ncbi:MAG: hypothetical protein DWQ01_06625 [Planctomycetota bacterium]|nr:MAG: hypothetical protein DWQ01_06625 [Planctomycetota bacterium]
MNSSLPPLPNRQEPEKDSLWWAAKLAAIGYLLIGASTGIFVWTVWGANRPHEVKQEGQILFYILLAVHAALCLLILYALYRAWRRGEFRNLDILHYPLILFSAFYAGIGVYFFGRMAWVFLH